MSANKSKGNKRNKRADVKNASKTEFLKSIGENNRTIQLFTQYSTELDDKHDRYERIVKLSRDITIESKRIIFLLHNINTDIESKRTSLLEEANSRLTSLVQNNFKAIANELEGHESYLYHKAYTSGLQEFIEALCFYHFLNSDNIENWSTINLNFQYDTENGRTLDLLFPQYDFILGIADFTGELMRRCINSLGMGLVTECFKLCNFVKDINAGFLGVYSPGNREVSRKAYVLRQSLSKMELVCYNIHIRGSEVPKHMLLNVIESAEVKDDNEDEGFY